MSVTTVFDDGRKALGLEAGEEDQAAIKLAYRRAVAEHPPDRDADGFRRIRDAYELLRDPCERARDLLLRPLPLVPPPAPPAAPPPPPRGATALAILRLAAMRAEPDAWSQSAVTAPSREDEP